MRSDFSLNTVAISLTLTIFLVLNKKNEFGPFSYKFFVPMRVGLKRWKMLYRGRLKRKNTIKKPSPFGLIYVAICVTIHTYVFVRESLTGCMASQCYTVRQYSQHASFIPIVGVGKRCAYY